MDKQSLLNKISFILQDLKSQHLKLTGNVDRIPEIDLDLFLANASFLVNHLEVLKKINGSSQEVRERDDLLKNLFNPKELEKLLENPAENLEGRNINPPMEGTEPQIEAEKGRKNEEFSPQDNLIVPESDLNNPKQVQDFPHEKASVKTRNESFMETHNNFILPFTNKQGVFALELERKAAFFADQNEEKDPEKKEKDISKNLNRENPYTKPVSNSLNDTFNQELKALRDLNNKKDFSIPGQNQLNTSTSSLRGDPKFENQDNDHSKASGYNSSADLNSVQKREPSLLNKLGSLPVKDIRKSIGLNEHLLFIKTLFHGDPAIYDRTLSMIDTFNSSEQAFQFLQDEISGPFQWESKKAVAELFKNIVNRKFAGNR